MELKGQSTVCHNSPVFLLVLSDHAEWGIVEQFRPVYRLTVSEIVHAFALNDFPWHSQPESRQWGHRKGYRPVDSKKVKPIWIALLKFQYKDSDRL
jgi:hypothetical protein